jgi:hypothetical protein
VCMSIRVSVGITIHSIFKIKCVCLLYVVCVICADCDMDELECGLLVQVGDCGYIKSK